MVQGPWFAESDANPRTLNQANPEPGEPGTRRTRNQAPWTKHPLDRTLLPPVRISLVGVANPQKRGFIEWPARHL
jgi:hypothetical protein